MRYIMLCGCGFPNSTHNFEPVIGQFSLLFPQNRTILTIPESPMFSSPEADSVTKHRLQEIREAGRQYGKNGTIDAALYERITLPMIPEEMYARIVNGGV